MSNTPNLGLPYLEAAQAQKHVTHNEAIRRLDAIVQIAVIDRDLTAPPGSPSEGDRYIVASGATGAWTGRDLNIAAWLDGAWEFFTPREGWLVWVADEDNLLIYNGSAWIDFLNHVDLAGGDITALGINASADATNRLAVSGAAVLLNHEGADHRLKINKNAAGDTASLLFQTDFSGRAEMGLTGDDDYRFKVSPDGSAWSEAIVIDRNTGEVTFPNTTISGSGSAGREVLTADRDYYVDGGSGSDSNDGLSPGNAFATLQKAVDTAAALDLSIYDVTINVANGTYTTTVVLKTLVGAGKVIIEGDTGTPSNVTVAVTGGSARVDADCFLADFIVGAYQLKGLKLTSGAGAVVYALGPGTRVEVDQCDIGASNQHFRVSRGATVATVGDYTISGGAGRHFMCESNGKVYQTPATVTLSGTPDFSQEFVLCRELSFVRSTAITWSGSATGQRYDVQSGSLIFTAGAGASYFPGDSAGSEDTSTSGHYV